MSCCIGCPGTRRSRASASPSPRSSFAGDGHGARRHCLQIRHVITDSHVCCFTVCINDMNNSDIIIIDKLRMFA